MEDVGLTVLSKFKNKKVLVTGNTGFKGSWLTSWLLKLDAEVFGYSIDIPTQPSMYEALKLNEKVHQKFADVRDYESLKEYIEETKPDYIFHMAAQPIVSESYRAPLDTISTNVMGTANLLEAVKTLNHRCNVLVITSDKCYENVEWLWGYRETDRLGGKDIYSASKAAAEIVFSAFSRSFIQNNDNVRVASVRAGNVIGGGDWAADRIVADCMRAWSRDDKVTIRCPSATRPWQHVLEPLSGYLTLALLMDEDASLDSEQFNFGPRADQNHTVEELLIDLAKGWGWSCIEEAYQVEDEVPFNEASLLKLNCDKALSMLKWQPTYNYDECVSEIAQWYGAYYQASEDLFQLTLSQITRYEQLAEKRNVVWAI